MSTPRTGALSWISLSEIRETHRHQNDRIPSREEIRAEVERQLGSAVGAYDDVVRMFFLLRDDAVFLFSAWCLYREFFTRDRAAQLDELAPGFFGTIVRTLISHVIVWLSRFGDAGTVAGQSTISVRAIFELLGEEDRAHLQELYDDFMRQCRVVRQHRNRRLAHNDYGTAVSARELPDLHVDEIEAAILSLHAVLNGMQSLLAGSRTAYTAGSDGSDLRKLLFCIEEGQKLLDAGDERWMEIDYDRPLR